MAVIVSFNRNVTKGHFTHKGVVVRGISCETVTDDISAVRKIIIMNVSVKFTAALTEAPLNQECLIGLKL